LTAARVACFGILVADVFVPPLDELPAAGQLVSTDDFLIATGGCAANVALALRRLGVPVAVGGRVGDDVFGELVRRDLSAQGVDTRGVLTTPGIGTSKTVVVPVVGEDRRFLHTFGANAALAADDILAAPFATAEVIYVGGYLILPSLREDELAQRLGEARARGATVILDVVAPSGTRPSLAAVSGLLPHVDYFVPNHDEARAITGEDDPRRQAELFGERGARTVMVKLGERGLYVRSGAGSFALDAPPVEIVEPSGAGDAFAAGLAAGILEHWPLERTAGFASVLGASACTALGCGAGVFTREQAEAFASQHPLPARAGLPA
jgi:sugar/nucleoside kinase (ribokinase family)